MMEYSCVITSIDFNNCCIWMYLLLSKPENKRILLITAANEMYAMLFIFVRFHYNLNYKKLQDHDCNLR